MKRPLPDFYSSDLANIVADMMTVDVSTRSVYLIRLSVDELSTVPSTPFCERVVTA